MSNLRIGVIGPTDPLCSLKILGLEFVEFMTDIEFVGQYIANLGHSIVICPDIGEQGLSMASLIASAYRRFKGREILGVIPIADERWGSSRLDRSLCDKIVTCDSWGDVGIKLLEISDKIVVIGLSPGTMIELCWGKWIKKKLYILKKYISTIPQELINDIEAELIDITDLSKIT